MHEDVHGRFFFQAEDGIRDRTVTGVQTCALPIFFGRALPERVGVAPRIVEPALDNWRSEERRVGKECRSRWGPQRGKKKGRDVNWPPVPQELGRCRWRSRSGPA